MKSTFRYIFHYTHCAMTVNGTLVLLTNSSFLVGLVWLGMPTLLERAAGMIASTAALMRGTMYWAVIYLTEDGKIDHWWMVQADHSQTVHRWAKKKSNLPFTIIGGFQKADEVIPHVAKQFYIGHGGLMCAAPITITDKPHTLFETVAEWIKKCTRKTR